MSVHCVRSLLILAAQSCIIILSLLIYISGVMQLISSDPQELTKFLQFLQIFAEGSVPFTIRLTVINEVNEKTLFLHLQFEHKTSFNDALNLLKVLGYIGGRINASGEIDRYRVYGDGLFVSPSLKLFPGDKDSQNKVLLVMRLNDKSLM